jgi:hypothetical protein
MKIIIPLLSIILLISIDSLILNAQKFEGKIIYQLTYEKSEGSNLSDEMFDQMFNDLTNSNATYYIKDKWYRLEMPEDKANGIKQVILVDPIKKKIYMYDENQKDFCLWSERDSTLVPKQKVYKNDEDTISILGVKCSSFTSEIETMMGITKNKVYLPIDVNIDMAIIEKYLLDSQEFISGTGIIPYKMISSGNGAQYNIVFTLKEIINERIDDSYFEIPKFKTMFKMPNIQK